MSLFSGMGRAGAAIASVALWMGCSSLMVVLQRTAAVELRFNFPCTLCVAGSAASGLAGALLWSARPPARRIVPSLHRSLTAIVPMAALGAAALYLGNLSYGLLSMAFIQIIKAAMPAVTMAMLVACGLEPWSLASASGVALIAAGTGACALLEADKPSFSLLGIAAMMASVLAESLRVVLMQANMHGARGLDTVEALAFVAPLQALMLGIFAGMYEVPEILRLQAAHEADLAGGTPGSRGPMWPVLRHPALFSLLVLSSAAVQATAFLAVRAAGSLTVKVWATVRNVAIVLLGVLAYQESVTPAQVLGYTVATGGFLLYTYAKAYDTPPAAKRDGGDGGRLGRPKGD